ncbi:hypothetical protein BPO_1765 [Bergeyella porcorum]|uniref:GH3 auxin-responsive promoter n=1 Tax=Bergeyella porcorum TaxID=1735111 RepID=A0AAU0F2Y8_9FLAO
MLKFIKKTIALLWAKRHIQSAQEFKDNAVAQQEQLLLSLVKTAEKTLFGRVHQFEKIHSVEDFQQRVPIADYEDLKPYIEKVKRGQANILWTGTPEYFAKTSGTTSGANISPSPKKECPTKSQQHSPPYSIIW